MNDKSVIKLPLIRPTLFPATPDWPALFGNDHPLELEIGFGRPHFFLDRARVRPEHNIVGIEWKRRHVFAAQQRALRDQMHNTCALHGNAWWLTGGLFKTSSLDNIFIHFPDPWWKKKHQKRRIVNDVFAELLISRLKIGGHLFIQSDVASLLEGYMDAFEPFSSLENKAGKHRLFPVNPTGARSHREKKCVSQEIPIFRALYQKIN